MEEMTEVQCPSCFEWFGFMLPPESERSDQELDYDCEVCCRPMRIMVHLEGAYAIGMDD